MPLRSHIRLIRAPRAAQLTRHIASRHFVPGYFNVAARHALQPSHRRAQPSLRGHPDSAIPTSRCFAPLKSTLRRFATNNIYVAVLPAAQLLRRDASCRNSYVAALRAEKLSRRGASRRTTPSSRGSALRKSHVARFARQTYPTSDVAALRAGRLLRRSPEVRF